MTLPPTMPATMVAAAIDIPRNTLFGVNVSGPEFAPWNGQTFPSEADWSYLRSKGVGFVRMPFPWEPMQPTLGAALDGTFLATTIAAITAAKVKGIDTILELHNFGAKITTAKWTASDGVVAGYAGNVGNPATGVNFLGDGTLTSAHLADLWTRLMTALKGLPGLIGVGIMNEPSENIIGVNRITPPNYFGGANWFITNGAVRTKLAEGTNPLGASYGPAWQGTSGSGFGSIAIPHTFAAVPYVFSVYARVASGSNANFYIQIAGTNSPAKTLTTSWQRFEFTRTPSAGASNVQFGLLGEASAGVTFQMANAQLELGSAATTYEPNRWKPYAQAAIDAIRAVDATIPIYVCGFKAAKSSLWLEDNYEQAQLSGTNIVDEAHLYFDGPQGIGGGGAYSGSYASYSINATTGSAALADFIAWASAKGRTPYLGEFGIPAGADAASWLAVQAGALATLRVGGVKGTSWFYGSNGVQPSNKLNVAGADDARLLQVLAA